MTWQRCSVGQQWKEGTGCVGDIALMTWKTAMAQPKDGWRVPTRNELATLLSPTCEDPRINEEVFPDLSIATAVYWTSSETPNSYVSTVSFFASRGGSHRDRRDVSPVRLVRSGP